MIVKSLIVNIGHGLNGNKFMATPLLEILFVYNSQHR